MTEQKKIATRYYVVIDPQGVKKIALAVSEQQAKAIVASLEDYTVRIAKPADMIGVAAEDILDATRPAK